MRLQARELLRIARKHNAKMFRYETGSKYVGKKAPTEKFNGVCAVQLLSVSLWNTRFRDYQGIAVSLNRSEEDIRALEDGFEGWPSTLIKNRYYKVGERFRKMIGL